MKFASGWVAAAGVLLALGCGQIARANGLADARAAYKRGDYATELRLLKPLADKGNGVAQDSLGMMYELGLGVRQNSATAVTWYRKAAEKGVAAAQDSLGTMYNLGLGVPKDYAKAVFWLRKAADRGNADAQASLGILYDLGHGVPKNDVEAYKWFNLAAAQGRKLSGALAKLSRERAAQMRDKLAAHMTPAQIAQAQKLVREWKRK